MNSRDNTISESGVTLILVKSVITSGQNKIISLKVSQLRIKKKYLGGPGP